MFLFFYSKLREIQKIFWQGFLHSIFGIHRVAVFRIEIVMMDSNLQKEHRRNIKKNGLRS